MEKLCYGNKLAEVNTIKEINSCCKKTSVTDDDKQNHTFCKLDEIHSKKDKGANIRSRPKWIEEGKRSTSYFNQLEK